MSLNQPFSHQCLADGTGRAARYVRTWRTALAAALLLPLAAAAAPPLAKSEYLPAEPGAYADASLSGGPGKDGIPSIDEPSFRSAQAANERLEDGDPVIGLYRNGEARAYPQHIVVWHEIVNDTVGGDPVSITYCPLTGTALGFHRGDTQFGVSGRLVNSNLIMYDRASDTLWPQILGAGIDGPNQGAALRELRVVWTTWGQWRDRHPDTRVLSTDTGHIRNYRRDPYGSYNPRSGYYRPDSERLFPVRNEDERFALKRVVLGFRDRGHAVAVTPEQLADDGIVRVQAGDSHYLVIHDPGLGTGWVFRGASDIAHEDVRFTEQGPRFPGRDQLTAVNAFQAMWFAWAAFYPDTRVVGGNGG